MKSNRWKRETLSSYMKVRERFRVLHVAQAAEIMRLRALAFEAKA